MQTSKINFQQVRGFSDSITVTFNFIKQEFKPLITAFAVIVLPWIFVDLFVKSYVLRDVLNIMTPEAPENPFANLSATLVSYLSSMVVFYWVFLYVITYLRIYCDKFRAQDESRITVGEIWHKMMPNIGRMLLWGFLYVLAVLLGTVCLIIPGIYLGVAFIFSTYFLIIRDCSVTASMSASMNLIRGQWWNVFGYIIVLQLIVGGLSYIFSIPYMVLTFKSLFTQQVPGIYEMTFGLLLANLGQFFLYIISLVGIGVRFFSLLEQEEHITLLGKIEQLGTNEQSVQSEETL